MNAIIIAAGSGKRISEDAKDLPKSLLMVNGKPIIVHQIQALKQVGIENIIVITGAHSKKFEIENVRYVKDHCYNEHDILGSLMEAKDFLKNDTCVVFYINNKPTLIKQPTNLYLPLKELRTLYTPKHSWFA